MVEVGAGGDRAMLSLAEGGIGAKELFPDLSVDGESVDAGVRGFVLSDRGVYRPGLERSWSRATSASSEGDKLAAARPAAEGTA